MKPNDMGRSQVLYNQRHGKQRGGRKGQRAGGHQRHVGRRSEAAPVEHTPQHNQSTSSSTPSVHFHGALVEENLLASFTQAYDNFQYGAGDYGSSVVTLTDGLDDDIIVNSMSSLSVNAVQDERFQQKNRLHIDAMALAKLLSTLPSTTRLNLSDDMGNYLVNLLDKDLFLDDEKKSLTALKLESLREAHERAYEEEQRAFRQTLCNRESNTSILEFKDERSRDTDNSLNISLVKLNALTEGTMAVEAQVNQENEEEDLDAWLDSVIS